LKSLLKQKGIYLTARGQDINRQPNILYISADDARSWIALHEFVDVRTRSTEKMNMFFFFSNPAAILNISFLIKILLLQQQL
jgi:hypothetical protein